MSATTEFFMNMEFTGPDLRNTDGSGYVHPISGAHVPGVTTIAGLINKPHLIPWSAKLAAQWAAKNLDAIAALPIEGRAGAIMEAARHAREHDRNRGSLAHDIIDRLAQRQPVEVPEAVEHQIKAWREFANNMVAEFIHCEATVWSHRYGYAGTLDAIAHLNNGELAMVDYKTGKDVYPEVGLQLWALRNADVIVTTKGEQPLPAVDTTYVLHLPAFQLTPTGKVSTKSNWSLRPVETREEEGRTFLSLLDAWQWHKGAASSVLGGKRTRL